MMVKVLVYAYAAECFSSPKIARTLNEDIAFLVLAADNFPSYRDFRAQHLVEFTKLFTKVVRLAREMELVKLGTIAIDGTKLKANASHYKAMSYARMQTTEAELQAQIAALLHKATHNDEAEKSQPELEVPAELECKQARLTNARTCSARSNAITAVRATLAIPWVLGFAVRATVGTRPAPR